MIVPNFLGMEHTSRIIVTTREENIAKVCSQRQEENIYMLKDLDHTDARDLFSKKVLSYKVLSSLFLCGIVILCPMYFLHRLSCSTKMISSTLNVT